MSYRRRSLGVTVEEHEALHRAEYTPPPPAPAESPRQIAVREALDRGAASYAAGKYQDALAEFLGAFGLSPQTSTIILIARTLHRLDRFDDALGYYREYLFRDRTGTYAAEAAAAISSIEAARREPSIAEEPRLTPAPPRRSRILLGPEHYLLIGLGSIIVIGGGLWWYAGRKLKQLEKKERTS